LLAICISIKARYVSGGHGKIGKKFPINHNIIVSIDSVIRKISMVVKSYKVLKLYIIIRIFDFQNNILILRVVM